MSLIASRDGLGGVVVRINRLSTGSILLFAAVGFSLPALAQTASQITPPSFVPPAGPGVPARVIIPEGAGAQAPAGSEALEVLLSGVSVEGAVVPPGALVQLESKLTGRRVKVSEIFAAARELEASFARSGRVLARVAVPAQSLTDGTTLHLVVVEGFIERVDTSGVPQPVREPIAAALMPLIGNSGVTLEEIERRLLLAADVPGVSLRSTLTAGSATGATVLVIEARYRPVTGLATFDNMLPEALGRFALGVGINLNSVLGAGETVYLRASGFPSSEGETNFVAATPRNRVLAAGAIVPLGSDGLTVNVEGTDARTTPRHDAGLPGFGSHFQRLSGRLRYPVVRLRALTVAAEALFDAQDERVQIIDPIVLPLSLDRLRVARAAGDLRAALPHSGVASLRAEASFGLDAFGARSASDASPTLPLSRSGADAAFQKLELTVSVEQSLASHLAVALRGRAQTSFGQALLNSEQIGLASADALSVLPSGTVQGDAGYVGRGELSAPAAFGSAHLTGRVSPYVFGAYGGARYERPTLFERRTTDAYAYGAGVRLWAVPLAGASGLSLAAEYGRAHIAGMAGHPDRFSFTVVTQF